MSRIGKKPIPLPKGVKVEVDGEIKVTGPKGTLTVPLPQGISVEQAGDRVDIKRESDQYAALHGLTRALASNAVTGVSTGFTRKLEIVGIGYRADVKGQIASFSLGYSHPIEFLLPTGVSMTVDKPMNIGGHPSVPIVLASHDKQLLGETAAKIRALRPPDPYKNKGVRYSGEPLRKKVGKAGAGGK